MKSILRQVVNTFGFEIIRRHPIETRAREIYAKYATYTMIPEALYVENLKLIWEFKNVKGCIVECGVWRGGMSAGIASLLQDRVYFLFDSFEGLPEARAIDGEKALAWQKDTKSPGYYDNCKAEIDFAKTAMDSTSTTYNLVKGWFSESLPKVDLEDEIAILRLDGDWYDSTMDCLTNLYHRVARGGVIIFDDYYAWDGCARAVHDFLSKTGSASRIHQTSFGVPYIIKQE